jgi:hypothetical protein
MTSIETTITSVLDVFPALKQKNKPIKLCTIKSRKFEIINLRKYITITAICFIHFIFGIVYTLKSGTYWVEFIDTYAGWLILTLLDIFILIQM